MDHTFVAQFDNKIYIANSQAHQFKNASSYYKTTITLHAGCFLIWLGIYRTLIIIIIKSLFTLHNGSADTSATAG